MPASWIKEVPACELDPSKDYFIARKFGMGNYVFYSRWLNGKTAWSSKPGIAVRFVGDSKMRKILGENPDFVSLKVPANADKKWRSRKKHYR